MPITIATEMNLHRAIDALAELHNNAETSIKTAAIEAARRGAPAFWSTATYHNQRAVAFVNLANADNLNNALSFCADHTRLGSTREFLLTCLIPLNQAARDEIERARGLR